VRERGQNNLTKIAEKMISSQFFFFFITLKPRVE